MTKLSTREEYTEGQKKIFNAVNDRYHSLDYDIRKIEMEIRDREYQLKTMWVTRDTLFKWLKEQPID